MQGAYLVDTEEGERFFECRKLLRSVEDLYAWVLKIRGQLFLVHSTAEQLNHFDKACTPWFALKGRESYHVGSKLNKCSHCGEAFTRKNVCNRHIEFIKNGRPENVGIPERARGTET